MRGQTSQAPGGGWDARACKGEEGCLSFHLKVLKSTFTAKHTPSIAHSELCVLDSLAELALGGKKREVAVTLRSITSGSLSPLPPHQRGSQSGLSCLSVALEGCCPQHSPPLGGTEGRAVWASPPRPHGSYGGGGHFRSSLVTVLHHAVLRPAPWLFPVSVLPGPIHKILLSVWSLQWLTKSQPFHTSVQLLFICGNSPPGCV